MKKRKKMNIQWKEIGKILIGESNLGEGIKSTQAFTLLFLKYFVGFNFSK